MKKTKQKAFFGSRAGKIRPVAAIIGAVGAIIGSLIIGAGSAPTSMAITDDHYAEEQDLLSQQQAQDAANALAGIQAAQDAAAGLAVPGTPAYDIQAAAAAAARSAADAQAAAAAAALSVTDAQAAADAAALAASSQATAPAAAPDTTTSSTQTQTPATTQETTPAPAATQVLVFNPTPTPNTTSSTQAIATATQQTTTPSTTSTSTSSTTSKKSGRNSNSSTTSNSSDTSRTAGTSQFQPGEVLGVSTQRDNSQQNFADITAQINTLNEQMHATSDKASALADQSTADRSWLMFQNIAYIILAGILAVFAVFAEMRYGKIAGVLASLNKKPKKTKGRK